jgi:thioredoxin 1
VCREDSSGRRNQELDTKMRRNPIGKYTISLAVLFFLAGISLTQAGKEGSRSLPEVPAKNMVTMLDLGAHKCIPCKMMAPIIEKLKKEYKDKAAIIFIDVWQNRDQGAKYGIRAIPTQIFFDKKGNEVRRHVGFMGEKDIVAQLKKMGVH